MFRIRIEKTGEWESFVSRMEKAAAKAPQIVDEQVKRLADDSREYLLTAIRSQWFQLAKLNKRYQQYKIRRGLDPRTLIKTGKYLTHIHVFRDEKGYRIGVDEQAKADNGRTYVSIAKELEFGTATQPSRPHWRPTMEWSKKAAKQRGLQALENVLRVRR